MKSEQTQKDSLQMYLDSGPYSEKNISLLEKIFGKTYISPGGKDSAEHFIKLLNLSGGEKVLDVACGAGGPALLMARYCILLLSAWN